MQEYISALSPAVLAVSDEDVSGFSSRLQPPPQRLLTTLMSKACSSGHGQQNNMAVQLYRDVC